MQVLHRTEIFSDRDPSDLSTWLNRTQQGSTGLNRAGPGARDRLCFPQRKNPSRNARDDRGRGVSSSRVLSSRFLLLFSPPVFYSRADSPPPGSPSFRGRFPSALASNYFPLEETKRTNSVDPPAGTKSKSLPCRPPATHPLRMRRRGPARSLSKICFACVATASDADEADEILSS